MEEDTEADPAASIRKELVDSQVGVSCNAQSHTPGFAREQRRMRRLQQRLLQGTLSTRPSRRVIKV